MRMPMANDGASRHVGFAPQPFYSRRPAPDEKFVMQHFHDHAEGCGKCHDPYSTYLRGGTLCDKGHKLAKDVADYIYSRRGTPYSVLDRERLNQEVKVEISPKCHNVVGLLQALDHGLRVRQSRPQTSHDKNYYVPTRPQKSRHYDDYRGGPVKEPRRYEGEDRRYREERKHRKHRYEPEYAYEDRHRHAEKRHSLPSKYASYGSRWEEDIMDRKRMQPYHDSNQFIYYRPSKHAPERRIPRSESPKREAIRRMFPEEYRSSKHGLPSDRRSSRYDYPDNYHSSRYSSPDSYHSSRRVSPDSYQSSRRTSPEGYPSRRSSWSPHQLYRDIFR